MGLGAAGRPFKSSSPTIVCEAFEGRCPRGGSSDGAVLLLNFLTDTKALSESRVKFSLPWSAGINPIPPSEEACIIPLLRFSGADSVKQLQDEDSVGVYHDGELLKFHQDAASILGCI
jgi:hypothetical protein